MRKFIATPVNHSGRAPSYCPEVTLRELLELTDFSDEEVDKISELGHNQTLRLDGITIQRIDVMPEIARYRESKERS